MGAPPQRLLYRRAGGGFLCLARANLEDWAGDAIATSTNRRLEGNIRRNWWGFAGRKSADAALHERAGDFLARACRQQVAELDYGAVLVTKAGPNLGTAYVLHTTVPSHPAGQDSRPLPPHHAGDYTEPEEAEELLGRSYDEVLRTASELGVESLCCSAIGCGFRGFPLDVAASIGLGALGRRSHGVPYVEVRFWEYRAFFAWREEATERCPELSLCDDEALAVVEAALWEGEGLAARSLRQRKKSEPAATCFSSCPLL